jgi:NhaP-type Na+/H+ or K+/H+ antiporter
MPVGTVWLLASIGVLSLFCQWLAWRLRMPAILFLLAGGIASGPVLGYLNPEDVFGALLAVLVFEGIVSWGQGNVFGHSLYIFAKTIAAGTFLGVAAGYLNGQVLRKHWMPQYLHNAGTLTFMLGVYALSNELAHESGLLTVTTMGIWMANMKQVPVDSILEFKESLSVLLIGVHVNHCHRDHSEPDRSAAGKPAECSEAVRVRVSDSGGQPGSANDWTYLKRTRGTGGACRHQRGERAPSANGKSAGVLW